MLKSEYLVLQCAELLGEKATNEVLECSMSVLFFCMKADSSLEWVQLCIYLSLNVTFTFPYSMSSDVISLNKFQSQSISLLIKSSKFDWVVWRRCKYYISVQSEPSCSAVVAKKMTIKFLGSSLSCDYRVTPFDFLSISSCTQDQFWPRIGAFMHRVVLRKAEVFNSMDIRFHIPCVVTL